MSLHNFLRLAGLLITAACFLFCFSYGQSPTATAFPSLTLPASSRGLAMGNTGIAAASGNQQLFYNMAKTAFTQNFHQASITYMPWLAGISNDTRFMNINYLANASNESAFGVALTYLDYGSITTRDNNGASLAVYRPKEFNLAGSYALQLGANASLGLTFKMISENIYIDVPKNIFSVCGDIGYYQFVNLGDVNKRIEWGATISNLGPKVSVDGSAGKTSLPTNFGVGVAYSNTDGESGDQFTVSLDANKLLVPEITGGLHTLRLSTGAEYGFMNSFFLRGGFHLENKLLGNRKYIGLGVGYKGFVLDQSWGIDFHYLVPFGTVDGVSPFANSFGFTLHLSFGNFQ